MGKEYERKWKWPNLRQAYYTGIYLEGLRRTTGVTQVIVSVPLEIQTGHLPNTITAWTNSRDWFVEGCKDRIGKLYLTQNSVKQRSLEIFSLLLVAFLVVSRRKPTYGILSTPGSTWKSSACQKFLCVHTEKIGTALEIEMNVPLRAGNTSPRIAVKYI
jgi:hypothetical protein